jgi:hypothetical protein
LFSHVRQQLALTFTAIFGRGPIETLTIALMADVNNIFDCGSMPAEILQQNLQPSEIFIYFVQANITL